MSTMIIRGSEGSTFFRQDSPSESLIQVGRNGGQDHSYELKFTSAILEA